MSKFYVEQQFWKHWPKKLVMIKKDGLDTECRYYLPERTCHAVYVDCGDGVGGEYCSECKNYLDGSEYYCPNCGAKIVD